MWAEMRTNVTYQVDIALDQDGVVIESQCECGAGQAPTAHCKHVVTVLYAMSCFNSTGEILTALTCTQVSQSHIYMLKYIHVYCLTNKLCYKNHLVLKKSSIINHYIWQKLQTFHRAKPHKGSPMKAASFQTVRGKEQTLVYDPRPEHMRNRPEKKDQFRNMCINSQANKFLN